MAAQKLKSDLSDLNSDSTLCPGHLLRGIKALLTTLKTWLPDIDTTRPCPPSVDPAKLVRELAKELRLAEKVTLKCNPPKPERESKRKKQKKGLEEDFIDISKSNAFLFLGRRKKAPNPPKEEKKATVVIKDGSAAKKKPTPIKIVPKKRKIDLSELDQEQQEENDEEADLDLEFKFPASNKSRKPQSPKHIKLKLPMSLALNSHQPYDLTDRDSVRQLLSSQKRSMKQLDNALGDALADMNDEDLVIDEKPLKLKLSIGGKQPTPSPTKSSPLNNIRKRLKKTNSKAMEDMRMTKVHQDDDYVYPSLELSDDEMDIGGTVANAKDDAWTPKVKVPRGSLEVKTDRAQRNNKKVAAVEAGLRMASEKRRKIGSKKAKISTPQVVTKPMPVLETSSSSASRSVSSSLLMSTPASASSTLEAVKLSLSRTESTISSVSNKKPKKGLSTAKQRLGKILKLKF